MWIDNDADFSDGSMNNKTFTVTVNVYANGKVVTIPENTTYNFDYTGSEQTFIVPITGKYKLETWGSQGGSYNETYRGGYGAYSTGIISLIKNETMYINVGGAGSKEVAGYNGGITGWIDIFTTAYGSGGATHISTKSGLLSELSSSIDDIIIVSGAGGGTFYRNDNNRYINSGIGGDAGGYIGRNSYGMYTTGIYTLDMEASGGSQTSGGTNAKSHRSDDNSIILGKPGSFGLGGFAAYGGGGGAGYYGGGGGSFTGGGGGSSYIANPLLTDKAMYCYNCQESTEEQTKTISTTCTSETPTANCSKQGNGYVKITYLRR